MDTLLQLVGETSWQHVVMALMHSLWQGAVAAAVVYALLRAVPARRVNLRYGVALASLLVVPLGTMAAFAVLDHSAASTEQTSVISIVGQGVAGTSQARALDGTTARNAAGTPAAPAAADTGGAPTPSNVRSTAWAFAAAVWLAGAVLMLARAAWMVHGAGRLRRECRPVD